MKSVPSEIFKVLGVETRLRIIELLKSKGPIGATTIAQVLRITPAAVSQHLKLLKHAGLVRNERKGYWIPYSIDEAALERCRCMLNEVCTCGCKRTGKFKEQDLHGTSLASLVKYEKALEEKLQNVRERISGIRAREK
jgi:DNA-binding transcriptional ArsR family regulator